MKLEFCSSEFDSDNESGYSSLASTPGEEHFPTDWPPLVAEAKPEIYTNNGPIIKEPKGVCFSGETNEFLIKLGPNGTLNLNSDSLRAYVVGPSGSIYNVITRKDADSEEYVCSFRSVENGIHQGYVFIGSIELPGSSFTINLARDYSSIPKPVISLDVEMDGEDGPCQRKPWGICIDPKREVIYVPDREFHEVIAFSPEGDRLFSIGKRGSNEGEFRRPAAVAFDSVHEMLYVTDKDNHRVQVFTREGKFIRLFGKMGQQKGEFYFPWGITVSPCGMFVAVADSRNHRIQLFDHEGNYLRKFYPRTKKSAEHGELNHANVIGWQYPRGITFDLKGEFLYVTDFNGHGVFKLHINFTYYKKIIFNGVRRPSGLCVDEAGQLLVCDTRHNAIKVYSPEGNLLQDIRKIGDDNVELPTDVCVLGPGFLVVLDLNGRVRVA